MTFPSFYNKRIYLSDLMKVIRKVRSEWRTLGRLYDAIFATKHSICPRCIFNDCDVSDPPLCFLESACRERKLRCFFGITTGRIPDRKRALAERAFRSSGSFPRVNREHLSSLTIRDLAHDRLPFTLTTHRNSTRNYCKK